jgi:hypothetical protein
VATFTVHGPFEVPTTRMKVGRAIMPADVAQFWMDHPEFAKERGCYVFGFRASRGSKPIYIGKATKTFKQETFTDHKMRKYGNAFNDQAKGTPIMFFVCLARTRGAVNKTAIDEVESYLIQQGLTANARLLNDRKTSVESWCIGGLVRSRGRASAQAAALKRCLNL